MQGYEGYFKPIPLAAYSSEMLFRRMSTSRWQVLLTVISMASSFLLRSTTDNSLYLTPLIEKGDISTAQRLSLVKLDKYSYMSHAGFITVDKQFGNHIFFWHFPSQQNKTAPLLMWLNGGPAVSSMLGLFWEHGPFEANREKFGDSYGLREITWVRQFSVVYVDNPVGTGYSFSEKGEAGYKLSQAVYTQDLYSFVLQFFQMFPEYRNREFYLTGQSYAGKYVPALAYRIHQHIHNGCKGIPLTGIMLGGPLFDPETQFFSLLDYQYIMGAVSFLDVITHKNLINKIFQENADNGTVNVSLYKQLFKNVNISVDNYATGKESDMTLVENIVTSLAMRRALHVDINRSFQMFNKILYNLLEPDMVVSTAPQMNKLLDSYKVLIYNGDFDAVVSTVMLEEALLANNWSLKDQYANSTRNMWISDGKLKGFYSQTGQFCRVALHGAGHQAPHDVPDTSLEMVLGFVNDGCIVPEKYTFSKGEARAGGQRYSSSLLGSTFLLVLLKCSGK